MRLRSVAGAALDLLVVWALTAPAWLPLTTGRMLASDDGGDHLYRLLERVGSLRAGELYARWAPDFALGYGYPVFNYYAPASSYVGAAAYALGTGLIAALEGSLLVAVLLGGAAMYTFARTLAGRLIGVVAGVLYATTPYFLVDVYTRSAIAESLALGLLPLVALGLRNLALAPSPTRATAAGLAVSALVLTHNVSALLALPPIGIYALVVSPTFSIRRLAWLAGGTFLGVGLSAFFWLPALAERHWVRQEVLTTFYFDYRNHFHDPASVVQSTFAYAYRYSFAERFFFGVGLVQAVFATAGAVVTLIGRSRRRESFYWVGLLLLALFLQTSTSAPLWEWFPVLGLAQFPWRFLALVALSSAVLVATALARIPPGKMRLAVAAFVSAGWLAASLWQVAPYQLDLRDDEVSTASLARIELDRRKVGTTAGGEYLPIWASFNPHDPFAGWDAQYPPLSAPVRVVRVISSVGSRVTFEVDAASGGAVVLDRFYFPGWSARADGVGAAIRPEGERGLLAIDLPAGARTVAIEPGNTTAAVAGTSITLASVLALVGLAAGGRARRLTPLAGAAIVAAACGVSDRSAAVPSAFGTAGFAGGPRLVGAFPSLPRVDLFWTADGPVERPHRVALRLLDAEGRVVGRRDQAPRYGLRPTNQWRPGYLVHDLQDLELLPGGHAGEYELVVGLQDDRGYALPIEGRVVRWREECPCAGEAPEGVGVSLGRVLAGAPPARTEPALPLRFGGKPESPRAGRIELLDGSISIGERPPTMFSARVLSRLRGASTLESAPSGALGGPGGVAASIEPGATLQLGLRWRALADSPDDYSVTVQLQDHHRALVAQDDAWPRRGFSPTSTWRTGQEVLDSYSMRTATDLAAGRYDLWLALYRRADLKRLTWSDGRDELHLGTVKVVPTAPVEPIGHQLGVRLGTSIELVGLRDPIPGRVSAGATIVVRPRWRVLAAPDADYTAFVHLVDASGRVAANGDAPPRSGGYPTSLWEPGEEIDDSYAVAPPATGRYRVLIGLYRPVDGARLGEAVDLGSVEVS